MKSRPGFSDLKTESGEIICNNQQKADMFNEFFSSVYTDEILNDMPSVTPAMGKGAQLYSVDINDELSAKGHI